MGGDSDHGGSVGALSGDDRGQTLQDFVTGVSVLLVVVVFVLSSVPGSVAPFTAGIGGDERAQADRIAGTLVSNLSVEPGNATLSTDRLRAVLDRDQSSLRARYALPETASVNVTVRNLSDDRIVGGGGSPLASDQNRRGEAATATRVVDLTGDHCRPGCLVVVKVW